jgi:hypothetical protein
MNNRLSYLILILLSPSLVFNQGFGYKMITINTNPSGAELFLNGNQIGKSPATVRVQDGLLAPPYMVRIEKDGYKPMLIHLEQKWKTGVTIAGVCCGLLFIPGLAILIYAKEHNSVYLFNLQKETNSQKQIRFDPNTGLPIE